MVSRRLHSLAVTRAPALRGGDPSGEVDSVLVDCSPELGLCLSSLYDTRRNVWRMLRVGSLPQPPRRGKDASASPSPTNPLPEVAATDEMEMEVEEVYSCLSGEPMLGTSIRCVRGLRDGRVGGLNAGHRLLWRVSSVSFPFVSLSSAVREEGR